MSHTQKWLLKMHGCVSHPEEIVLTRQQYLRYEDRNAALAGIVQALLITKHMLFLGFSLQDDNFHRVIDAVRKALSNQDKGHRSIENFGTCLFLIQNGLIDELWEKELDLVSMEPYIKDPKGTDWGRTARKKRNIYGLFSMSYIYSNFSYIRFQIRLYVIKI